MYIKYLHVQQRKHITTPCFWTRDRTSFGYLMVWWAVRTDTIGQLVRTSFAHNKVNLVAFILFIFILIISSPIIIDYSQHIPKYGTTNKRWFIMYISVSHMHDYEMHHHSPAKAASLQKEYASFTYWRTGSLNMYTFHDVCNQINHKRSSVQYCLNKKVPYNEWYNDYKIVYQTDDKSWYPHIGLLHWSTQWNNWWMKQLKMVKLFKLHFYYYQIFDALYSYHLYSIPANCDVQYILFLYV